jgi:hypothetical protein
LPRANRGEKILNFIEDKHILAKNPITRPPKINKKRLSNHKKKKMKSIKSNNYTSSM